MQPSTVLNQRYRIVDLLAEGGMARVYRGHDLLLDRTVAVKVLREQYAADRAFVERFQQEARAAAGLAHPNIVAIYDVGAESGTNYIVMELVEGASLKQIIQQEAPCGPARAIDLVLELLAALSFAHERGIVHRDVKPQNVLVTGQGHVKVADFGIARAATASQLTETGLVMGSVHYCAPEQALGKGATQASDVYAAGVVLYEMLTGRLPFESDTALGVALQHVQEPPPPPRQFNPQLSPGLESIVLKALAKDPAQRYASATDMSQALQAYRRLGEQATAAFVALASRGPVTAAPAVAGPAIALPIGHPRAGRPPRRRTFDWLVLTFGLLILAMIAAWVPLGARLYDLYFRPLPTPARVGLAGPIATPVPKPTLTPTPQPVVVPNLVGLSSSEAERKLESLGLRIGIAQDYSDRFRPGIVTTQTVPANGTVSPGAEVGVIVSRGAKSTRVPGVLNLLLDEAKTKLEQLGLRVDINKDWHDRVPQGRVISQFPLEDSPAVAGTIVSLLVSLGRPPTTAGPPTPLPTRDSRVAVPNVVRLTEAEARDQLDAARLSNAYTNYQDVSQVDPASRDFFFSVPVGSVVSQEPKAGTLVKPGTTVYIAVRKN